MSAHGRDRERGAVLAMVLILSLLLSTVIVGFARRAVIDTLIVRNRDGIARAEALARGGIRIATGILLQGGRAAGGEEPGDLGDEPADKPPVGATYHSLWARLAQYPVTTPDGGELRLSVQDVGARLNLNAFVPYMGTAEESAPDPEAEEFLVAFFDKVIEEIPLPPGEKFYDSRELARSFLDYVDANEDSSLGGFEDDWYQQQTPPRRPPNGPLLSVDELALVQGFDSALVEAIRPYVTVYPFAGTGINLNTAPPHVLAAIYHGSSSDMRLADEDVVRRILKEREEGSIVCHDTAADERCVGLADVELLDGAIYPPVRLPTRAAIFAVRSEARVAGVKRRVDAIIDLYGDEGSPQLLSWRVR